MLVSYMPLASRVLGRALAFAARQFALQDLLCTDLPHFGHIDPPAAQLHEGARGK